jgi:hypothetical protein
LGGKEKRDKKEGNVKGKGRKTKDKRRMESRWINYIERGKIMCDK